MTLAPVARPPIAASLQRTLPALRAAAGVLQDETALPIAAVSDDTTSHVAYRACALYAGGVPPTSATSLGTAPAAATSRGAAQARAAQSVPRVDAEDSAATAAATVVGDFGAVSEATVDASRMRAAGESYAAQRLLTAAASEVCAALHAAAARLQLLEAHPSAHVTVQTRADGIMSRSSAKFVLRLLDPTAGTAVRKRCVVTRARALAPNTARSQCRHVALCSARARAALVPAQQPRRVPLANSTTLACHTVFCTLNQPSPGVVPAATNVHLASVHD